ELESSKFGLAPKKPRLSLNDFSYLESLHGEIKNLISEASQHQINPLQLTGHLKEVMEEVSYMKIESESALKLIAEQTATISLLSEQIKEIDGLKAQYSAKDEEIHRQNDKIDEL